jgi:hypothetical protein
MYVVDWGDVLLGQLLPRLVLAGNVVAIWLIVVLSLENRKVGRSR